MKKESLLNLQEKAISLKAQGKYKDAINVSYQLLEWGTVLGDYESVLAGHLNNALSYYSIGAMEESFKSIDAYREVCSNYGSEVDQLDLCTVLFLLYEYNKDIEKAIMTLEKSIQLGKKFKKYQAVSVAYSNYSHIQALLGNYRKALELAETGLKYAKINEPFSPILVLRVKLNIANAYIGLQELTQSGKLLKELLQNPLLDSFVREKAQCYELQGAWYANQKQYREALEAYTYAKELLQSYNDVYLLKAVQEERIRLCELMGDIETGYTVQKEHIALLEEISERELALEAFKLDIKHSVDDIEKKANTDYLTGLYNRSYVETTANDWLQQDNEIQERVVCIAFDIDNFKPINDMHGHLFGDEVIKQVAKTCANIFRKDDIIGRYGGDEFIVLLKDISLEDGKKKAVQIAETLRNIKLYKDGEFVYITVSIGVATNEDKKIKSFSELFHLADMALYQAKEEGKNRICLSNH